MVCSYTRLVKTWGGVKSISYTNPYHGVRIILVENVNQGFLWHQIETSAGYYISLFLVAITKYLRLNNL